MGPAKGLETVPSRRGKGKKAAGETPPAPGRGRSKGKGKGQTSKAKATEKSEKPTAASSYKSQKVLGDFHDPALVSMLCFCP